MACPFANVYNACGCLIGYNLPLKTVEGIDITSYPVNVLNINDVLIAAANSPTEYVALWNSDPADQAKGVLRVGSGSFCFFLGFIIGVTPPSFVLGSQTVVSGLTFKYGWTELDTTGITPDEASYIASVDDVFTNANELTGTFNSGGNIQVDDFTNPSDKVLFIQVPISEAAFTKWSEFGNPFQQNQTIDPDFATGSNVFFKSTRAGELIYITRSQTTITGATILSR